MKELIRSTNAVLVHRVRALLADEGIESFLFDFNASVMEGSIGALPQRVLVTEDDEIRARRVIREAGLGEELVEDKKR